MLRLHFVILKILWPHFDRIIKGTQAPLLSILREGMHSWFSYIKGKTTITDKHCSHVSWNQSFWQRKKRKKVRFLYNLFSKSEPFQCTGTVGKYPVFIFGIFQIVGGACQAGIMKNSWYAGGKKCQILSENLVPVLLCVSVGKSSGFWIQ